MDNFLAQLKQRQVFKVATIYAVSAWPLIQIADLAVPALGLPDSAMTLLLKIFVAGFPLSLVFAWVFNFTANGIVRAKKDVPQQNTPQGNMQTTIAVVGALLIVFTMTLGTQLFWEDKTVSAKTTQANSIQVTPASPLALAANKKESIAILPFIPFSLDPKDEFFADGMVEELLNLMAKIPDLQVSARTSSFAYKGVTNKTIVEIGKELGVDTILEGSIRKNDVTNKIRVTAQLIKVSTGEHLWSETYDREYRDIFQIQDDIANAVVKKLKITLLGKNKEVIFVAETTNIDAMIAHGKGKTELAHRTSASITKALQHFEYALSLDNGYARAHVGIADANILLASYGNLPWQEANEKAEQAINIALTLNNQLGAAYATRGILIGDSDPASATLNFKKAIELSPNYATAYLWYGLHLVNSGQLTASLALFKKAFELDPKSPIVAYAVAQAHYNTGSEEKAMELFAHIIVNDPYYPGAYNLVGDILVNRGRLDEATEMYKRALDVDPDNKGAVKGLLKTALDLANFAQASLWLDYAQQRKDVFSDKYINYMQSEFYAAKGDKQQAVAYLSKNQKKAMKGHNAHALAKIAFYQERYQATITALEQLRAQDQGNEGYFYRIDEGEAALQLAYAYQQNDQQDKADALINEYELFLQNGVSKSANRPSYYYNMTQIKLLQRKKDESLYYLQGAIDAGWLQKWKTKIEPSFVLINQDTRFAQMMGGIDARLAVMRTKIDTEDEFLLADVDNL